MISDPWMALVEDSIPKINVYWEDACAQVIRRRNQAWFPNYFLLCRQTLVWALQFFWAHRPNCATVLLYDGCLACNSGGNCSPVALISERMSVWLLDDYFDWVIMGVIRSLDPAATPLLGTRLSSGFGYHRESTIFGS